MEEKMKTIWIVLISFVATAVIVGGGTYALANKKATTDKNKLQAQINDLNTKLTTATKSLATAQAAAAQLTATQAAATAQAAAATAAAAQATAAQKAAAAQAATAAQAAATQAAAAQAAATVGWQTYTDKTYGFSFKYPATYTVNDSSSDSDSSVYIRTSDDYWEYFITVTPNTTNGTLAQISTLDFTALSDSISAYTTSEGGSAVTFPQSDITIGGVAAKKMITSPTTGYSPSAEVDVIKGGNIIKIEPRLESAEFDTLLSSFQFSS